MSQPVDLSDADRQQIRRLIHELPVDLPSEKAAEMMGAFAYFRSKAGIYLRKGPDAYRQDDYFSVPRLVWSSPELLSIEKAFRQIVAWQGLTVASPLEHVDPAILYRIVEITHFQFEAVSLSSSELEKPVAVVSLTHRMDGRALQLCFRTTHRERMENRSPSGTELESGRFSRGQNDFTTGPQLVPELFGYLPECPIVCSDPYGERSYIHRLRCSNGHPFFAKRVGSLSGICPDPETHTDPIQAPTREHLGCIVDRYDLCCRDGEHRCRLFFDMYHHDFTLQPAPSGLSLAQPEDLDV